MYRVNATDPICCVGLTPLILASAAGHVDVCEVLLQHKADIDNVSEKNKDTALSLACSNGRLEVYSNNNNSYNNNNNNHTLIACVKHFLVFIVILASSRIKD